MERDALGEERVVAAYGTAAAIAQAIGGKKTKALEKFARAVQRQAGNRGGQATAGDSADMSVLRARIKQGMAEGTI